MKASQNEQDDQGGAERIDRLERDRYDLKLAEKEYLKTIEQLKSDLASKQAAHDTASSAANMERDEIQSKVGGLEKMLNAKTDSLESKKTEFATVQDQLTKAKAQLVQMQQQLSSQEDTNKKLQKELDTTKTSQQQQTTAMQELREDSKATKRALSEAERRSKLAERSSSVSPTPDHCSCDHCYSLIFIGSLALSLFRLRFPVLAAERYPC